MWEIFVMAFLSAAIIFGLGLASAYKARKNAQVLKQQVRQSVQNDASKEHSPHNPNDMAAYGELPKSDSTAREKMATGR